MYDKIALIRTCSHNVPNSYVEHLGARRARVSSISLTYQPLLVKLRHYEKATKFEKISPLVLAKQWFFTAAPKQEGDFFKFL